MEVPLWQWSAANLAKAIREKKISSQEVIQAHLDRIEAVNHKVNAVTVVLGEDALRTASEADKQIAAGENVGPLHGVPITVKENFDHEDLCLNAAEIIEQQQGVFTPIEPRDTPSKV